MPIVDPYALPPWILSPAALKPEDILIEPESAQRGRYARPDWFRWCYARALLLSTGGFSCIGLDRIDPKIERIRQAGIEEINPQILNSFRAIGTPLDSNSVPEIACSDSNSVPEIAPSDSPISCQDQANLEENSVPLGHTPTKIFRGGPPAEKYTSLQEMTFSEVGLSTLRAEEPAWEVVSGLGAGVGVGNWKVPKLVIVGGNTTDSAEGVYPFFSRAGSWLFRALRSIGWDECHLFLCNAAGPDGNHHREELRALHAAFAPHDPVWLALGAVAERVTRSMRKKVKILTCVHPSHHCRKRHVESPREYARMLQSAGLPIGDSLNLAVENVGEEEMSRGLPFDLPDLYQLPKKISLHPDPSTPPKYEKHCVAKDKSEVARVAFVTGEVRSISAAAKATNCNYDKLLVVSKREGWKEERERHQDMVREKALSKSAEVESREISKARTTAWSAAVKAVDIVNRRLESGKYVPNAMDAARLVSMAMDLTTASGVGGEHEREKVRNRTIAQIGKDLVQTLQSQFGKDVIDVKAVVRSEPDESS